MHEQSKGSSLPTERVSSGSAELLSLGPHTNTPIDGACDAPSANTKDQTEVDCDKSTTTGRCQTQFDECIAIVQLMVGRDFNHYGALQKHHDILKQTVT